MHAHEHQRRTRGFWLALIGVVVIAGALRFLLLAEYTAKNPLAEHPLIDAEAYWSWAGRIADGIPGPDEPFFSAPLYPYFVGLIRAGGGGLPAVYVIQVLLDLGALVLLAWIGMRRFGPTVGLTAAVLFALTLESASFSARILGSTLQLPIVCLTLLALLGLQDRPKSWGFAVLAGALIGFYALSYPPAMLLVPLVAIWLGWRAGRNVASLGRAGVACLAAILVISPATVHNYRACGELILISAQAGLTFAHGNSPGADGTYTPQPGISPERATQNRDANRAYQQATGNPPSWNGTNRHFLGRGFAYWREQPLAALRVTWLKLWYFLTGRNYGDIYIPVAERAEGFARTLWLMPIHTAWLMPLALVGIAAWFRRAREHVPELLLFCLPLLTVLLFFYSPRYRYPALPLIVLAGAWTIGQVIRDRRNRAWAVAGAVALVLGPGVGMANYIAGFDPLAPRQAYFCAQLGLVASDADRHKEAEAWYRKALRYEPEYPPVLARLGATLANTRRPDEAVSLLQRAVEINPADAFSYRHLGRALLLRGQVPEARQALETALAISPEDADIHNELANALLRTGDRDGARTHYDAALRSDPNNAEAHVNLGLLLRQGGEKDEALEHFRKATRLAPTLAAARYHEGTLLLERGDARGLDILRRAHELAPDDLGIAGTLAWYLATVPGLPAEDRAAAIVYAQRLNSATRGRSPQALNALAAAYAANGRFDEAMVVIDQAITAAEAMGVVDLVIQLRDRRALYKAGKPSVTPIGPSPESSP
jgi:tetratricopeptide (TPR) repeat protein